MGKAHLAPGGSDSLAAARQVPKRAFFGSLAAAGIGTLVALRTNSIAPLPQEAQIWTANALIQGVCAILFTANLALQILKPAPARSGAAQTQAG